MKKSSEEGADLRKYCFVFQNKRSSFFFQKYLGEAIDKPVFAPDTITVNELFSALSEKKTIDRIALLARLYEIYSGYVEQSFDEFIFWGDMILGDFDDIDKYRVNAEDLFTNINDLKDISSSFDYLSEEQVKAIESFWGTVVNQSGQAEQHFRELWENLYKIYDALRKGLDKDGLGYEGMIYRDVADRISEGRTENISEKLDRYDKIVFVGLNALNECERQLLDYLKNTGKGDFYWDYYGNMVTDRENKSSMFMEKNIRNYPSELSLPENGGLPENIPHIEVLSFSSATGQAKYVNNILKDIVKRQGNNNMISTAVVLPDETMLFPVLNSIPEEIDKVNVTMGYPLSQTGVSSFVNNLFSLLINRKTKDNVTSFYVRNVMDILSHPYIKKAVPKETIAKCRKAIIKENIIYVPSAFFSETEENDIFNLIFCTTEDRPALDYIKALLEKFATCADSLEKEFFLAYYRCINQINLLEYNLKDSTYYTLVRRLVSGITVPFRGEPLAGLQIMGPLETRSLDFENVIILSVNEGVFPSVNTSPTMIPYNLRRGFRLPAYEYQDAVSAYHFYRSISRAKNVYLLYDSSAEGLKSGEESRYVKQLEYNYSLDLDRKNISYPIKAEERLSISYPKDDSALKKLREIKYSPSAISMYMRCSLQFYYRYVKNLSEEKEIAEDVDAALFGSLFHMTMQLLYEDLKEKEVTPAILDEKLKNGLDDAIDRSFEKIMKVKEITGKNLIIRSMIKEYVTGTVKYDAGSPYGPFKYIDSERNHEAVLKIDDNIRINIEGIIDRQDRSGGHLRIVDYKTGRNKDEFNEDFDKMFARDTFDESENVFQLYYYLTILMENNEITNADGVILMLYYVRKLFGGTPSIFGVTEETYQDFHNHLVSLFKEEILNKDKDFTMCEDAKICEYCPFKVICNR